MLSKDVFLTHCVLSLFQLTGLFQFTIRLLSEVEARFTSVERINHYIKVIVLYKHTETFEQNFQYWNRTFSIREKMFSNRIQHCVLERIFRYWSNIFSIGREDSELE